MRQVHPHTILLLPHPEHRERLLAPGAPVRVTSAPHNHASATGDEGWVFATEDGRLWVGWTEGYWADDVTVIDPDEYGLALVLARDGAVVPEGVDRLSRVSGWAREPIEAKIRTLLGCPLEGEPALARTFDSNDGIDEQGSFVLLDERGEVVGG